jgi:hypothetical protein
MIIFSKTQGRLLRDETNSRLFGQSLQASIPFNHNILYFLIDTDLSIGYTPKPLRTRIRSRNQGKRCRKPALGAIINGRLCSGSNHHVV